LESDLEGENILDRLDSLEEVVDEGSYGEDVSEERIDEIERKVSEMEKRISHVMKDMKDLTKLVKEHN
jgi:peptidoglycan hydrolase CwlO-like protein